MTLACVSPSPLVLEISFSFQHVVRFGMLILSDLLLVFYSKITEVFCRLLFQSLDFQMEFQRTDGPDVIYGLKIY